MILFLQGGPPPEPEALSAVEVLLQYVGFAGWFAVFGALGFRFAVLRGGIDGDAMEGARRGAARIGLAGAALMLLRILLAAVRTAGERHVSVVEALRGSGARTLVPLACAAVLLIAFGLALGRVRAGWGLAAAAGVVLALRNVTTGRWFSVVNPLHETAAALWLGTLFVLLVAGLPAVLRTEGSPEARGRRGVTLLVSRFSPLALAAAALLGITGVTTAWRHLKHWSALWTTPYGYALDVKLALVLCVVALGAWNWRRMTPRLGDESAAHALRRSARAELSFAALVLLVTGVLVSLPAPKAPGEQPPPALATAPR
ncbi:MAG TPA: CopD family protein [Longimicrobium sp.]|jgi:copper transport protein|nr:CopD family protein [Longimicrobium sp.]